MSEISILNVMKLMLLIICPWRTQGGRLPSCSPPPPNSAKPI